ncbi:MAG TPA: hypothetical protein VFE90_18480 [Myxococcales bacterium]|nr:hypothetical protein [Myxococcales bacterium]
MRRTGALLAALIGCARVSALDELPDAGPQGPVVEDVAPVPGQIDPGASFTVSFSAPMDEGQIFAASGRSETVVLAAEADVERAAAAIEHAQLSAHERTLLAAAGAEVSADRRAVTLTPDQPLTPGGWFLLISPRLKDDLGRHVPAARFGFNIAAPIRGSAQLIWPPAGGEAPSNISLVRVFAAGGRTALVGPGGNELVATNVQGSVALRLPAALASGQRYSLAVDGVADATQSFVVADCARSAPPAVQGGSAQVTVRDVSVDADLTLDWPSHLALEVEGEGGAGVVAETDVQCAPPVCGPQSFSCPASLRIEGLEPATDYTLRITAQDDFGHTLRTAPQPFSTLAAIPRVLVTEVMASGVAGEYVEILNLGPGAADLEALALHGPDDVLRPLLAVASPLPLALLPGGRALAVGASFDARSYPGLPAGTPVLRTTTQRLLGHGLSDTAPPAFQLVSVAEVPVVLSSFPGDGPHCPALCSLQRDESIPPDGAASWTCGPIGGTPGAPP